MNRRNFISGILQAGTMLVLPSAKTYERIWKQIAKTEMPADKVYVTVWSADGKVFNQFTSASTRAFSRCLAEYYAGTMQMYVGAGSVLCATTTPPLASEWMTKRVL